MQIQKKGGYGILVAIGASLVYGLYPACSQRAYQEEASVTFVILFTTFVRALSLAFAARVSGEAVFPRGRELSWMLSGGFFQSLSIVGIIWSLKFIPGPITVTVIFTHTLMLLLFLAVRREIRLNTNSVSSTLFALLGVTLVVDVWGLPVDPRGLALAFLGALATASRLYVFGKQVQAFHPAVVGARVFSAAFLFLLALCFLELPTLPETGSGMWWATLAAVSLSLGSFGTFYGIALIGSFPFSLMSKMEPIATALFSYLLLEETLKGAQYIGIALVIANLVSYQWFELRRKNSIG